MHRPYVLRFLTAQIAMQLTLARGTQAQTPGPPAGGGPQQPNEAQPTPPRPLPALGRIVDRTIVDPATKRRLHVRLRLPSTLKSAPLIIYSPGLGSGSQAGSAWCEAWRGAGFAVATIGHPVTDDAIWDTTSRSLSENLRRALSSEQYILRVRDCEAVIRACLAEPEFASRFDRLRIAIAGHSFGAHTVQSFASLRAAPKAGEEFRLGAAIALSPTARTAGTALAVAAVRTPFFCVTGVQDNYVVFKSGREKMRLGMSLNQRLAVYRSLPSGAKQLLVLDQADHMTFAGGPIQLERYSRELASPQETDLAAWAKVASATTAFLRYYLALAPRGSRDEFVQAVRAQLDSRDRFDAG